MSRARLLSSLPFAAALALLAPSALAQPAGKQPSPEHPAELPPLPRGAAAPKPLPEPKTQKPAEPKAPKPPKPPPPSKLSPEIRRLSDTFVDVAERVSPSVVQVEVTSGDEGRSPFHWLRSESVQHGLGSGVIYTSDGAILTNNHVIEEARSINVRLRDGRAFAARVAGRDPSTDLAVLRVDAKDLPAATFADGDAARPGAWVLAIGSPFGLGHTVTSGVLSAKGRGGVGINAVEDYLQTDASINPGNSGGPLVDLDGRVLGINTMIVSRGQGIGLAVPAAMARRVADQILKIGRVDRAYIGLGLQDLTPQLAAEIPSAPPSGAIVNTVAAGGPAGKAQIQIGDIIVAVGATPVHDAQDLLREVFLRAPGDQVTVELRRAGKKLTASLTLESRRDPPPPPLPVEQQPAPAPGLGLSLHTMDEGGLKGALVKAVAPDSAAERAGLRAGDVIVECDGTREPAVADVQAAAQDGHVLLRVLRAGTMFFAAVRR
ncbi:MAG: trypsin-like peptidase domain-containing protein [Byssovorax sp.]